MPHQLSNINAVAVHPGGNIQLGLHGIGVDDLGAMAELMLHVAGIHVVPIGDVPTLYVTATALLTNNTWAATLELKLMDHATITRNRLAGYVTTWLDTLIFLAEFRELPDRLRVMASNSLTRFANDLWAAQQLEVTPCSDYWARKPTAP